MTLPRGTLIGALACLCLAQLAVAQDGAPQRVDRGAAIAAAMARGPRLAVARADTLAASAQVQTARHWQNPSLSVAYSKSVPQYHYAVDLPLDLPYQRRPRIGSAAAAQRAARYRFAYEQASVTMEADTTYTRALAARAFAELSLRNARAADSLHRMTVTRRDAGDASDMDVALAAVTAGQVANQLTTDSLAYVSALLDLQAVMGLDAHQVVITLGDSLMRPPGAPASARADEMLLPVAAASAQLESATLAVQAERRNAFGALGLMAGFETGDPSGGESGRLPTFGLSLPIPLLNRNRGPIALARADEARARAELSLADVLSRTALARAQREQVAALAKVDRDQTLVAQANQVAAMSLTAYREGAASLANVLEAQRTARELLAQYVTDLADAWIADAELRVLTLTAVPKVP